tara:strand:- start:516 stop:794 length:279 start_codon:yes stop_codon:yes gene_type:complete
MDIKRTLTSLEEAILKHDLLEVQQWADSALDGKINNIKKRMCTEWRKILYADETVTQIPNDDDELVPLIIARDDYKTREERDAEQEALNNPE